MDFSIPYTEEQQAFREEVQAWLQANVPDDMREPVDPEDFNKEQYLFWREKHQELAAKGWLYPTYPTEYGGGGLTADHETILEEEFTKGGVVRAPNSDIVLATLLVWGTEEQKDKFLRPMLSGEYNSWQKFTEPQSGADLANYQSTAVRDGDDWILNGQNVFVSGRPNTEWGLGGPTYMWGPMLTDPDAPRHRNLGFFMIPTGAEGVVMREQRLINGWDQHFIFLDNVRVPGDHLVGGDHQGWQVTQTTLEGEHGGRGKAFPRDEAMDDILEYVQTTAKKGFVRANDDVVRQIAVDSYVDFAVNNLLLQRTYWMYTTRQAIIQEGIIGNIYGRETAWRQSARLREVMGLSSMLGVNDPGAPFGGKPDVLQRTAFGQGHAGGSLNIARVTAARRIGISRTQERPAPTPATATQHGS